MRYSYSLLGLAALATASDVLDLTKDTFGGFIAEHDLVLAECKQKRAQQPSASRPESSMC